MNFKKIFIILLLFNLSCANSFSIEPDVFVQSTVNRASTTLSKNLTKTQKIEELKPDVVFLDIQMPDLTGFEVIDRLNQKPNIIFTTAYEQYAIKAFETFSIDYLLFFIITTLEEKMAICKRPWKYWQVFL